MSHSRGKEKQRYLTRILDRRCQEQRLPSPTNTKEIFKVTVGRNSTDTANIFYINGVANPELGLARGNTYRFDTSDSSLYNILTTANHQLLFASTITGGTSGAKAYLVEIDASNLKLYYYQNSKKEKKSARFCYKYTRC